MNEQERTEIFKRHFKGISAHRTAQTLNLLNTGIDWRGSPKRDMLAAWIGARDKHSDLSKFTEDDLIKAKEKASSWWK